MLLLLVALGATGQQAPPQIKRQVEWYPPPSTVPLINITHNADPTTGWAMMRQPCAGCSSFYFRVTRSEQVYQDPRDGNFYFYFYFNFFSNSYYQNGTASATYLTGVNFFVDGNPTVYAEYILLEPQSDKFVAWIRSRNPNSLVTFTVAQMTVF